MAGDPITFNLRIAVVEHMDGGLSRRCIQGGKEIPQRLKSLGIARELKVFVEKLVDGTSVIRGDAFDGCDRFSGG